MELLAKLPFDLQEKVLEEYEKCEKLRALVRNHPIEITMAIESENMIRGEIRKNDFHLDTKIWCDENNLIRANFDIYWSSWIGWSYNLRHVPLGYIYEGNCMQIAQSWKKAFYEYLRFNHKYGKRSFENAVCRGYRVNFFSVATDSVVYWNTTNLKTKKLAQIMKRSWFNLNVDDIKPLETKLKDVDNLDDFDCMSITEPIIGRFRMDDSCPDLGSDFVRVPYTIDDLNTIKDNMPFIYKCLEDNDELWSPRFEFSPAMKKYIKLYNQYNDAPDTLPPSEEFNAIIYDIISKDLEIGWYSLSYDYYSKYVVLPKIHELMNWGS